MTNPYKRITDSFFLQGVDGEGGWGWYKIPGNSLYFTLPGFPGSCLLVRYSIPYSQQQQDLLRDQPNSGPAGSSRLGFGGFWNFLFHSFTQTNLFCFLRYFRSCCRNPYGCTVVQHPGMSIPGTGRISYPTFRTLVDPEIPGGSQGSPAAGISRDRDPRSQ